jgi:hypothetical protein
MSRRNGVLYFAVQIRAKVAMSKKVVAQHAAGDCESTSHLHLAFQNIKYVLSPAIVTHARKATNAMYNSRHKTRCCIQQPLDVYLLLYHYP